MNGENGTGWTASDDDGSLLVAAARRGDHAAWECLYRGLYPKLRSFFARRLESCDVEDGVNETMARAVSGIEQYTPGDAGFDGWVFGIARNVVADHRRRAARNRRQLDVAHCALGTGPDDAGPVDWQLDVEDDHHRLRSVFARLDPEEQEVLELRVVAGLSADQVGAVLQRRPGTVRTLQSRALAHLRRLMDAERVDA